VRGQVREYTQGSRQYRVLIVSSDEYNELPGAMPWGLVVQRDTPRTPAPLVELGPADPLSGASVMIPLVVRCDPSALRRNLGFVANDTLNAVERELRDHLNLP
jgi:mRNA-degrading endonuclease toxin of MazEF toxin-antitoxin module